MAAPAGKAPVCASGGDDAIVRLWHLRHRRLLGARPVPAAVTALSFDETMSDGNGGTAAGAPLRLAIGLESGGWEVLHILLPDLGQKLLLTASAGAGDAPIDLRQPAAHRHPPSEPPRRVNDLRFSPDGRWLAVASADATIHLHDTLDAAHPRVARCCGHSSAVTHLDWTTTSDVLRSNDLGHELRFWDVPSGEPITVASACRDLPWATARVTLGYHCQGIFRGRADGTGVHAVDRSDDGGLLVTADDLGQLNLFRNPCVRASGDPKRPGQPNRKSFAGHASAALDCQWAHDGGAGQGRAGAAGDDDACVVSAGGYDLALMQWRKRKASSPV